MEQPEGFVWQGENGERLRFKDLTPAEQRVALIAAGGLLRSRQVAPEQDAPVEQQPDQLAA